MKSFIGTLLIDVISSHEVKPRRRRNKDKDAVDRMAFLVCILIIRIAFLTLEQWPHSITISNWFFKQNAEDKRRRIGSDQNHNNVHPVLSLHRVSLTQRVSDVISNGADAVVCNVDHTEVDIHADNDVDDTVLCIDLVFIQFSSLMLLTILLQGI